ncbi:uncharacterized protein [Nicotiana tomentosiformis]|uniref:uncharacterized protein n=1 Tax=Nicotiana tomentosiformis TaxID=4098 RepID=UPI00388CA574
MSPFFDILDRALELIYIAPKKKARSDQRANATPRVVVDFVPDVRMLTQIVASKAQRLNVTPTSSSHQGDSASSRVNRFLHLDPLAAHAVKFENLKQGSMSVWDYHLRFADHSNDITYMMPTMEAKVHSFVEGLSPLVINESATAALNSDINYGKIVAFSQATETRKLKYKMKREGNKKSGPWETLLVLLVVVVEEGQYSGEGHLDRYRLLLCLQPVHCHQGHLSINEVVSGPVRETEDLTNKVTHPLARGTPAPVGHGATRDDAQSLGVTSRFYAMRGRQSSDTYPDVVTCILIVQSHDVYTLVDPGSTMSYITPYVAMEFGIEPEQLHELFSISTLVGESIMAMRVLRDCIVTVHGRDTMTDLIKLVMDWLHSCYAKLDCQTRK